MVIVKHIMKNEFKMVWFFYLLIINIAIISNKDPHPKIRNSVLEVLSFITSRYEWYIAESNLKNVTIKNNW